MLNGNSDINIIMARASISSQCCDTVASYMDGVHVKIAEAYKPPRKVTLPAAYNNKLPDISKHTYDFSLEKSVIDKVTLFHNLFEYSAIFVRIHRLQIYEILSKANFFFQLLKKLDYYSL